MQDDAGWSQLFRQLRQGKRRRKYRPQNGQAVFFKNDFSLRGLGRQKDGKIWVRFPVLSPRLQLFALVCRAQKAPEVDGVTEHRPNHIPPGDDDHCAIGEHPNVLHFLPAEHARTDTQYLTGVHVDERGKVIGEDFTISLHQQPVPGEPAKFQTLAHSGQGGNAAPPGVHVQLQQAFFHPPFPADGVDHVDAACAGNGNGLGEMVVSIQREGVFCYLAVFPAVNLTLVPLVGEVDPAQPVRHDAAMVFSAPAIFRQSPVFYILAGAPVSQFDPCGVGGIAHPQRMVSPAEGLGGTVISNGGRLEPVEGGWILA